MNLSLSDDPACKRCFKNDLQCVDFNNDKKMDDCWCSKASGCAKPRKSFVDTPTLINTNIFSNQNNNGLSIYFIDAVTNKQIQVGGSLFVGEHILINIQSDVNGK
jgi:hypothetical protein